MAYRLPLPDHKYYIQSRLFCTLQGQNLHVHCTLSVVAWLIRFRMAEAWQELHF
jgi:hypothetical protein